MNIEQARLLKCGAKVHCPADRGTMAFTGIVVDALCSTSQEHSNLAGGEIYMDNYQEYWREYLRVAF